MCHPRRGKQQHLPSGRRSWLVRPRNRRQRPKRLLTGEGVKAQRRDTRIYDNGPVNGTVDAWTINFGYVVSDSFRGGTVSGFDFYVWAYPGDNALTVDWSITSQPLGGGTVYGSGTAQVTGTFISSNQYGYDIDKLSVTGLNVSLASGGTYFLNLQNATTSFGDPVFWDENSGVGCNSPGCPSQAYESAHWNHSFRSVRYRQDGEGPPPPCFESGGNMQIIYDFSGQKDGGGLDGVVADATGNVYGTERRPNWPVSCTKSRRRTKVGYSTSCIALPAALNGNAPSSLIFGPEGALYGTAIRNCGTMEISFGLIFSLRPAPTACLTALCPWTESVVYQAREVTTYPTLPFSFSTRPATSMARQASGGAYANGAIFELAPSPWRLDRDDPLQLHGRKRRRRP